MTAKTFQFSPTVAIHYETNGTDKTPIVLLHGFGASLETWRDIQPLLQDSFSLSLVDLKGSGLSSKPRDGNYSLNSHAQIVEAFLASLQLDNVVLVGHSYGGAVALVTCLRLQQRRSPAVARLILIDSPAYPQPFPFFVAAAQFPLIRTLVNLAPAHVRASLTLKRIYFDASKVTEERIGRYTRFMDLPGAHYALNQYARQLIPSEVNTFVRALPTIQLPTLLIWGENNTVIPLSVGRRLKNDILGAVLEILPKCGHMPQEELPEATAQIIRSFGGALAHPSEFSGS